MAFFDPKLYTHILDTGLYQPIVAESANTTFYFAAGRLSEWSSGPFSPELETGSTAQISKTMSELIAGTRVGPTNVAFLGDRTVWQANVVYNTFDGDDTRPFYVLNSSNDLYKCIGNNNGSPSTTEPSSTFTSGTFMTADGYVWKYLSTISDVQISAFGSANTIPLISNTEVVSSTTPGTIDAVTVLSGGALYSKFSRGRVGAQISNTLIRVNNVADFGAGYYANTSFAVVDGTGAGTLTQITNSVSNSSGTFLTLQTNVTVDITSRFTISPRFIVSGDGTGFQGYVNLTDDLVSNVVVISPGEGYTYASASVDYPTEVPATFHLHVSPGQGHGSNLVAELKSTSVALTGKFTKSLDQYLPDDITYYQFALIKNPKDSSGSIITSNVVAFSTSFSSGGVVYDVGEQVVGETSNASGIIISSNSALTYVGSVSGTFEEDELVTGSATVDGAVVSNVVTSSYDKTSGQLLYYVNVSAINRTDTIDSENIRCVIKIEG